VCFQECHTSLYWTESTSTHSTYPEGGIPVQECQSQVGHPWSDALWGLAKHISVCTFSFTTRYSLNKNLCLMLMILSRGGRAQKSELKRAGTNTSFTSCPAYSTLDHTQLQLFMSDYSRKLIHCEIDPFHRLYCNFLVFSRKLHD
jgi:hypothetical protein